MFFMKLSCVGLRLNWRSWLRRWSDQRSCPTPGPVSTGMDDRIAFQLQSPDAKNYLRVTNHPDQLSLAIPPWVGAMSTGQRAVMLCGWGVKAGMARVWWQVHNCVNPRITRVLSECFRG